MRIDFFTNQVIFDHAGEAVTANFGDDADIVTASGQSYCDIGSCPANNNFMRVDFDFMSVWLT